MKLHRLARTGTLITSVIIAALAVSSESMGRPAAPFDTDKSRRVHGSTYVPNQVIVRYREGTAASSLTRARSSVSATSARNLGTERLELLQLDEGVSVKTAIKRLERQSDVLYAEPNFRRRLMMVPNDADFGEQWGLQNTGQTYSDSIWGMTRDYTGLADADIDATDAWDVTTGDANVVVAVIDTGVDYNHPDLVNNMWANPGESGGGLETNGLDDDGNGYIDDHRGWDFMRNYKSVDDNDPQDPFGHGTHVAGIIGGEGNDAAGITGVAQDVSIMPLKVFSSEGWATEAAILEAYAYARDNGADVVNGSYGGWEYSQAERDTIGTAPNTLFVFAAGNDGTDNDEALRSMPIGSEPNFDDDEDWFWDWSFPIYPASLNTVMPNVMSVAASSPRDGRADFSVYGKNSVDIAAPGRLVYSSVKSDAVLEEWWIDDPYESYTFGGVKNEFRWDNWWWTLDTNKPQFTVKCDETEESDFVDEFFCEIVVVAGYKAWTDAWVQKTDALDFTGLTDCRWQVYADHGLEKNKDFVYMEASTDGATWDTLGAGITGNNWGVYARDLSAYDNDGDVYLRLRLKTNGSVTNWGMYNWGMVVDNCQGGPAAFDHYDGTSMAAPHVAGTAALLLADTPTGDPAWLRDAIVKGADAKTAWTDKVRADGRLNADGALTQAGLITDPVSFSLRTPLSNSTTADRTPTFRWNESGADSGIVQYELFVDNTLRKTVNAATRTTSISSKLTYGLHSWRIEAIDADGDRTTSATREFRVKVAPGVRLVQTTASGYAKVCGRTLSDPCRYDDGDKVNVELRSTPAVATQGAEVVFRIYKRTSSGEMVLKAIRKTTMWNGVADISISRSTITWGRHTIRADLGGTGRSFPVEGVRTYLVANA